MDDRTLAEALADFAVDVSAAGAPDKVRGSTRERVLDILGLCVAAHRLPTSAGALAFVTDQGGRPQADAVGLPDAVPAPLAAFANGVLAHSLDYDDTHLPSVLHPSASVVPAALAVGQATGAGGAALTDAIAVGLEVVVRLGMAGYDPTAGSSVYFDHGQHATSICGAIGSGAAAALLLGLGRTGVVHTLGLTASMAAGIIEANRAGGSVKRLHCGWAAQSGVSAAQLVRHGFTGPPTVFEGRFGFFEAFLRGEVSTGAVTEGLGTAWAVPDIFVKPYPANHFTHAVIDAGLALRGRGLNVDEIETIEVGVPTAVVRTIGQPIERKRAPETGYQAQFSGPYTVVAGLLGGSGLGVGLADFTDDLAVDERRRQLMSLVSVLPDERCDRIFPRQFPAVVRVRTRDGSRWVEEVLTNRGGPDRPLSENELRVKFRDNVEGLITEAAADEVEDLVANLDEVSDLGTVLRPLRGIGAPVPIPG